MLSNIPTPLIIVKWGGGGYIIVKLFFFFTIMGSRTIAEKRGGVRANKPAAAPWCRKGGVLARI